MRKQMTVQGLYACKNVPNQRWGQAIVNEYGLKGIMADILFYSRDEAVRVWIQYTSEDLQLPQN